MLPMFYHTRRIYGQWFYLQRVYEPVDSGGMRRNVILRHCTRRPPSRTHFTVHTRRVKGPPHGWAECDGVANQAQLCAWAQMMLTDHNTQIMCDRVITTLCGAHLDSFHVIHGGGVQQHNTCRKWEHLAYAFRHSHARTKRIAVEFSYYKEVGRTFSLRSSAYHSNMHFSHCNAGIKCDCNIPDNICKSRCVPHANVNGKLPKCHWTFDGIMASHYIGIIIIYFCRESDST